MHKILTLALMTNFIGSFAQAADNGSFYDDILISGELKEQINKEQQQQAHQQRVQSVQDQAVQLLESNAPKIKVDIQGLPTRPQTPQSLQKRTEDQDLTPAPFGLNWGATILDTQDLGVSLTPIGEKDYVNSFSAQNLPKSLKGFRSIDLTFGIENELWRIIAYGDFLEDTKDASVVLRQYRRFYKLLERKYGNAQQFFTPQPISENPDNNNPNQNAPKIDTSIGNPDFLAQLQSGEAELYATFEGNDVGAALSVNVDGSGRSYIIIDYKNLKILREREEQALDAL